MKRIRNIEPRKYLQGSNLHGKIIGIVVSKIKNDNLAKKFIEQLQGKGARVETIEMYGDEWLPDATTLVPAIQKRHLDAVLVMRGNDVPNQMMGYDEGSFLPSLVTRLQEVNIPTLLYGNLPERELNSDFKAQMKRLDILYCAHNDQNYENGLPIETLSLLARQSTRNINRTRFADGI